MGYALVPQPQPLSGFIFMPGDILDWIVRLDGSIRQLDADVSASGVRSAFKTAWKLWFDRWNQFVVAHQSWWSRTSGSTADEVAAWEGEYNQWVKDYGKEPGNTGTFAHPSAAEEHGGLQLSPVQLLEAATKAALVVGGVYLAIKLIPLLTESRTRARPNRKRATCSERDRKRLQTLCDKLYDARTPERQRRDLSMEVSMLRAKIARCKDPLGAMTAASGPEEEE